MDHNQNDETQSSVTRRNFIKGVIATGAAVSTAAYVFRGNLLSGQGSAPGSVERLLTLNVNGQDRRVDVMKQETLAMTLRYKLGLTGTKLGCDRAECGACTVLIDDIPRYSCSTLTHSVRGKKVVSIEGLAAADGTLHPVQAGVVAEQGFQCAFCMPGFVMATVGYLKTNANPTRAELAHGISGNLCRCQDYDKILTAMMHGAQLMRERKHMANKLVGQNYTTPDLVAKVTGKAKYAEDFRAEGMLFAKLLLSPMPHARVLRIDTSAAEAMPGVKAILTVNDLPGAQAGAEIAENVRASAITERGLTMEPMYEGEPILAVAAIDEFTATEAVEKIQIEYEPLPFAVDPIASLRPGSANARTTGNVWVRPPAPPAGQAPPQGRGGAPAAPPRPEVAEMKWTDADFAAAPEGQMPLGQFADEWMVGDVEAELKSAALVIDRTWVGQNTSHQVLEPRSAMAYWQNNKLYLHAGTQSTVQTVGSIARWVGIDAKDVVLISEYTGGGFGSRIPGYIAMAIPALLSKKANAPVMMRITREDEHYIGRARPALHSRAKVGFDKTGRVTAIDLFVVTENGPFDQVGDGRSAGDIISLAYQPKTMRWRGVNVLTNTPPRGAQRAPGGMQGIAIMEPILAEAARKLSVDEVAIHRVNAPAGKAEYGPAAARGRRNYVTSAFVKEALDRGAEIFKWDEKKARSGKRVGTKVRGSGVAVSTYSAGSIGFDGLLIIRPDGKIQFQSGIGNLGTHAIMDVHRVAAEILDTPWDQCEVVWGDTSKNLPWSCASGGSQTAHAMTRAAHAVGTRAKQVIQEVASKSLGGSPASYTVSNGRVSGSGGSMTFAQVGKKAIELGGKYDGHEPAEDVNDYTKNSVKNLAGSGLVVAARDAYPRDGQSRSYVVGFAEVEVDVETGAFKILEYAAVADVGTVLNPRSLKGQTFGGSMLGIGHAIGQHWVYDQHYGVPLAKRFHYNKPPSILDGPQSFVYDAVNIADPETPAGVRGVGEPPVGAGCAAVLNAIAAAVGDDVFRRMPVTSDMILTALEAGRPTHEALTANI